MPKMTPTEISFNYTNHRGETARRRVIVKEIWWGQLPEYYPGQPPQIYISGTCLDRNDHRDFRLNAMYNVEGLER